MKSLLIAITGIAMIAVFWNGRGAQLQAQSQTAQQLSPDYVRNVHSRLFSISLKDRIPDLLSTTTGDITVTDGQTDDFGMLPDAPGKPPYYAIDIACGTHLVVLGTAERFSSHLTEDDETFLYSDWTFHVDKVLRTITPPGPKVGAIVTVVRPGGILVIGGRTVRASKSEFRDFESGKQYLLPLTLVPETQAYTVLPQECYLVVGSQLEHMTGNPQVSRRPLNETIRQVGAVAADDSVCTNY